MSPFLSPHATESERLASLEGRVARWHAPEIPTWIIYGAACGLVAYGVIILAIALGKIKL